VPSVEASGIRLHYEVHGAGVPLVVVLGLGQDVSESQVTTKPLAEKLRVLTFDNRGAGRSDKPDAPYTIETMARDTAAVIEAAGFGKSSVMGISLGGRIALELTLQRPLLVDKLLLVSTGARVQRTWVRRVLTSPTLRLVSRPSYPQPRYAFIRQREASTNYDATSRLGEIHAPTLIMHGKHDRVAPLTIAQELHQGIAGSKLVTFKGGHLFFLIRERRHFLETATKYVLT
jgi:3-oxoadipate enol-lactonase